MDIGNGEAPAGLSLIAALQSSGPTEYPDIECWYARRALCRVGVNLGQWESHPARTQEDVLRLVARAIEHAGGRPPSIPSPKPLVVKRRGGWVVGGAR